MKVLIACEYSGIVREAFKAKSHDAWSCDLLPTEIPGNHIQGNVLGILDDGWDLMIAHPPCTRLCTRGKYWTNIKGLENEEKEAIEFFMSFIDAPIDRIAVENPIGIMSTNYKKPTQIIQPYYFGDAERKATCLWLKNLQPLWHWKEDDLLGQRTMTELPEPSHIDKSGKKRYFVDRQSPSDDRAKIRSKTFPGIAKAMADQWG